MIKMTGKIYIVGIGPGSSEYLTKKATEYHDCLFYYQLLVINC